MPLRNLLLIAFTAVLSLACYEKAGRNRYAAIITDVMSVVEQNYLEEVERRDLFEHAMNGMVNGLDPYSGFVSQEDFRPFRESIEQKFGGIGIEVNLDPETKRLTVASPLFGTPAHRAGILSGDTILKIDGRTTEGMDLRAAVELMRGWPGTKVTLAILHRGKNEPVEMTLTRTEIHTETVLGDKRIGEGKWDFRLESDPRLAYVRVTTFGDDTARELEETLQSLAEEETPCRGIILDLRNNPGGTLYGAIDVADMFLDSGVIVSTRGRDGITKDVYKAKRGSLVDDGIPLAVLVNHYSASASEIVAACLQDHGRAVVIGERSWGKGTVQNVIPLEGGKSAVRLTTASYWRPNNHNIHRQGDAPESEEWGVSPDTGMEVKLTEEQFDKIFRARAKRDSRGDPGDSERRPDDVPPPQLKVDPPEATVPPKSEEEKDAALEAEESGPVNDPQLEKAIEYLQKKIGRPARASERA
jgi:carboxyl-terminal processing protease